MLGTDNFFDAVGNLFVKRHKLDGNLVAVFFSECICQCRKCKGKFLFLITFIQSAGTFGIAGERAAGPIRIADNLNGDLSHTVILDV